MSTEKANAQHIKTINKEMGELAKKQEDIRIDLATVKTDLAWLKRFFWIVATSSVMALLANLWQLLK